MKIEIVICTHNRVDLLAKVVDSINDAAKATNAHVTLLVILNACSDSTVDYLHSYEKERVVTQNIAIRWAEEPKPGKSYALNLALTLVSGDIVAFVDDDHRVDNEYLKSIHELSVSNPDATMFCGKILPDWDGREPYWAHYYGDYVIYPLPVPRYDEGNTEKEIMASTGPLPGGGNLVMRKEALARTGYFSAELGPKGHNLGGGEDSEYVYRALNSGEKLIYSPSIVQYHYVDVERFKLRYLMQKSFQRSLSVTRVRIKDPGIPPRYLWRKLFVYAFMAMTALYWPKTRFFLMRTSSALGEIFAYFRSKKAT